MVDIGIMTANKFHQVTLDDGRSIRESLIDIFGTEIDVYYDYEHTRRVDTAMLPEKAELPGIIYSTHDDSMPAEDVRERRGKRDIFCNHGDNAMCVNCAPVSPWDASLLQQKGIKYMSYGAYKQMCGRVQRLTYRAECTHDSSTRCAMCIGRAIALKQQTYRMVDHVEIDNYGVVDHFISYWRATGRNRIGYLIGRVEEYERVPLGQCAVVSAIYEPEQECFPDGFVVHEHGCEQISALLQYMGLCMVGVIYTDLNKEREHVLSCMEVDMMARYQNDHMFVDETGPFNSRLVSVVVRKKGTGIELDAYSVSEQGMVLVGEDIVRPCTAKQYFVSSRPIIYLERDEHGTVVERNTHHVPVEYMLVDVPYGISTRRLFREDEYFNMRWKPSRVARYFDGYGVEKFKCFNVIAYFYCKYGRAGKEEGLSSDIRTLVDAVFDKMAIDRFLQTDTFFAFSESIRPYKHEEWNCRMCTYTNSGHASKCEMCETARE